MPAKYVDDHRRMIGELIEDKGLTHREASLRLKKNGSYLNQYLKRGTPAELPERIREGLATLLGVDPGILREGGISMAKEVASQIQVAPFRGRGRHLQSSRYEEGRRDLPVLGVAGGAPDALFLDPGDIKDMVTRPRTLDAVENAYAVYHAGESMSPRYEAGETLIINPNRPVRSGCYVVIQFYDNTALVKRFVRQTASHLICEQLNPPQERQFLLSDVRAIHRVVGTSEE